MILLQSHSRFLLQTLLNRAQNLEKGVELDHHWVEFDDVRYHIQVSMKNPHVLLLSVSLPTPSSETIFVCGLPFGAIEAIKAAYGNLVQILDPPRDGFNLTLKINLSKLPANQEQKHAFLVKVASIREVVLGAPLRVILEHLAARTVALDMDPLVALVHRPNESFFLFPQRHFRTMTPSLDSSSTNLDGSGHQHLTSHTPFLLHTKQPQCEPFVGVDNVFFCRRH
uniref:Arp2/3 complex 34 kDa subunit n=1 Tax=Glycine max TaxID=3847 RepID=A0A0R0ISN1_SOYBN